jgi:predicted lactoylglutathione lyase
LRVRSESELKINLIKNPSDMTKELWVNLPVKSIQKSKDFFTQLGFKFNPVPGGRKDSAHFVVGSKGISVMLFEEPAFKSFTDHDINDTRKNTEVLFSIDADNRKEVNDLADKVKKAGGTIFHQPSERDGWMYGCGFLDPDGHRWNVLHMDMSKAPKA